MRHYLAQYLANSTHKITVALVGCGGTGSHMLNKLAMINQALISLNRPGLHVTVYDDDIVSSHNVGRQLFSAADVGHNKAVLLTTRVNRHYGTGWEAIPLRYDGNTAGDTRNITVSCVDTVLSRSVISEHLSKNATPRVVGKPFYWLDIGNNYNTGQAILGTVGYVEQPGSKYPGVLSTFFDEYPGASDDNEAPSCSAYESLTRQGLFINSILANYGAMLLWDLLYNYFTDYRGVYVNLSEMKTSKIPIM